MNKFFKFAKKIVLGATVVASAFAATALSACSLETKHPKAEIVVELRADGETVASCKLEYELYRNIHPATVRHFIELADEGFYNEMIVHDYMSNDWVTGAYAYADNYEELSDSDGTMAQYLNATCKEEAYHALSSKLTPSVYANNAYSGDKQIVKKEDALPTLLGEFKNNINQEIKNDPLTESFGCLKMFYYAKETTSKIYVTPTEKEIIRADYKSNCATSLFTIQVANSSSYKSENYSVFALLTNTDKFEDFLDEVDEYIGDLTVGTVRPTLNVDNLEPFSKENADISIEQTFTTTTVPLVIKSVKIKKY